VQVAGLFADEIEDALALLVALGAIRVGAGAEQALETPASD